MSPKRPGTAADRDGMPRKTPPAGVAAQLAPVFVDPEDEKTDVHNAAMRALAEIREIDKKLDASKLEAARAHGALKTEVLGLKTTVDKMDEKLDRIAEGHAAVAAVVEERARRRSGERPSIEATVEAQLAKHENAENRERRDFRRKIALAVVSGLFSGVVIVWLLQHYLGAH